ncbi:MULTISPECIES: LysM peptidoglycan-binding domain-containing protein [Ureibacillus]|uniref:LysM peptidoglycan-binding domain-containing protein n=1 Tax=Ureibacillus TaxID=160795 RepID=UPI0002E120E0|nr:LysM peptidoglycan-binding domain-containing protein [Ureibacillus thermosphaericus]
MRFFLLTSIIIIIVTVIKIDLTEGTVPLIAFSESVDQCNEQLAVKTVPVITKEGDTVQGLLAQYPTDERISVPERMADFYKFNPHLKNQVIAPGELIKIPIYSNNHECKK